MYSTDYQYYRRTGSGAMNGIQNSSGTGMNLNGILFIILNNDELLPYEIMILAVRL